MLIRLQQLNCCRNIFCHSPTKIMTFFHSRETCTSLPPLWPLADNIQDWRLIENKIVVTIYGETWEYIYKILIDFLPIQEQGKFWNRLEDIMIQMNIIAPNNNLRVVYLNAGRIKRRLQLLWKITKWNHSCTKTQILYL